jgi:hypothetical protein
VVSAQRGRAVRAARSGGALSEMRPFFPSIMRVVKCVTVVSPKYTCQGQTRFASLGSGVVDLRITRHHLVAAAVVTEGKATTNGKAPVSKRARVVIEISDEEGEPRQAAAPE